MGKREVGDGYGYKHPVAWYTCMKVSLVFLVLVGLLGTYPYLSLVIFTILSFDTPYSCASFPLLRIHSTAVFTRMRSIRCYQQTQSSSRSSAVRYYIRHGCSYTPTVVILVDLGHEWLRKK